MSLLYSVPFAVPLDPVMCLRVTSPPTLVCLGFFGQVVLWGFLFRRFPWIFTCRLETSAAVKRQEPGYPETPISRQETEKMSLQQTPRKISIEAMFSSPESIQLSPITGHQSMSPINLQHDISPLHQNDSTLSPVPHNNPTLSLVPHNNPTLSPVPHNNSTLSPVLQKLLKVVAESEKTKNVYKPPYLID